MFGRPMNPVTPALWMTAVFGAALNSAIEFRSDQAQAHYDKLLNASRQNLIAMAAEAVQIASVEMKKRKSAEAEAAALRRTIAALKSALAHA